MVDHLWGQPKDKLNTLKYVYGKELSIKKINPFLTNYPRT